MPNDIPLIKNTIRNMQDEDYKILRIFVSGLKNHDILTLKEVEVFSKIHKEVVNYRIKRLLNLKLINSKKNGFSLLALGLDIMALNILADKEIVTHIGDPIGIGKESDVVEAKSKFDTELAIKFFRIGRTSFRDVRRKRGLYDFQDLHKWHTINIHYAKTEYDFLKKLENSINVPTPLFRSLHCVVMRRLDAKRLCDIHEIKNPCKLLDKILQFIHIAYRNGIVNCDISEYNILVDNNDICWIIDWPQSITINHPNSKEFLKRDVSNIVTFFNKRFNTNRNAEEEFLYIYDPD